MPDEWGSAGTGAASGAGQGAIAGAQYGGPWGAAAGAVVGGVAGGASGYLGGRGIQKRKRAQAEAEARMRNAVYTYTRGKQASADQMMSAGGSFQRRDNEALLTEFGNRTAMAQNASGDMATQYARAMQDAQGTMSTAKSQIPDAELRSAAQREYAGQLSSQANQRALNAQMPGAYSSSLQTMRQNDAALGRNTQLLHGTIQNDAAQMQGLNRLYNAELDRDYAAQMGDAEAQMRKADKAGSEQMMYGAMINAGMQMGKSGASAYSQNSLQASDRAQNQAMQQEMMRYYKNQNANYGGYSDYGDRSMPRGA